MVKRYVDGYVLPVPKKKMATYKKMALSAGKMWMKHGALGYVECVGQDLNMAKKFKCVPFPKLAKTKPGETVVFAFVTYKSRAHRDRVNKKVMEEMMKTKDKWEGMTMPFETKRMAVGGFETIVNLENE